MQNIFAIYIYVQSIVGFRHGVVYGFFCAVSFTDYVRPLSQLKNLLYFAFILARSIKVFHDLFIVYCCSNVV